MTRRTKAVVTVEENGEGGTLSPDVAETLEVGGGDAIEIRGPSGKRATVLAAVEESLSPGTISAGPGVARECGVESGDQVMIERISPVTARRVTVAPVPGLSIRGGESTVRNAIGDAPVSAGEELEASFFDGSLTVPVRVTGTSPSGPVVVAAKTAVDLETGPAGAVSGPALTPLGDDSVGGYEETIDALRSAVVRPLRSGRHPEGSGRAGVVVTGNAGVGKTHLVRHAAWLADAAVHPVDISRVVE
jgi:transitional endoplasmic reticulum ATPase